MIRLRGALAALSIAVVCVIGPAQAQFSFKAAFTCPNQAEVEKRLTQYITVDYWSPGQRTIWQVKDVTDIKFGPIRTGQIGKHVTAQGVQRDACPVRVEYSFLVVKNNGSRETTKMGDGKTHRFFRDDFNDWQMVIQTP